MVTIERREGTVLSVHSGEILVRIEQYSACRGCHAEAFCCSTDCATRDITVQTEGERFTPGESVIIEGRDSIGRLAVLFSFIIPTCLTVATLTWTMAFVHLNELYAVLCLMGVLTVYYGILSLFKGRLKRMIRFQVVKVQ